MTPLWQENVIPGTGGPRGSQMTSACPESLTTMWKSGCSCFLSRCSSQSPARAQAADRYGNFDIGFDYFSLIFQLYAPRYAPLYMLYLVTMPIGC